jgi:hypothetical protein
VPETPTAKKENENMSNVAAKSEARPRPKKVKAAGDDRVVVSRKFYDAAVKLAGGFETNEERRAAERAAEESARRAVTAARASDLRAVYEEANDVRRELHEMTVAGILAYASGTCEPAPIDALLQEVLIRLRTLRAAAASENDYVMSENDWDLELFMLERRTEAIMELLHREHEADRLGGEIPATSVTANRTSPSGEHENLDAAAEE